jgi:photosystem II stability/assembly factor-like uncharacterized protein
MKCWVTSCCLALIVGVTMSEAAPVRQERWSDACLRAVYFVDASEGWAVGDDGVVWHSIDGGSTWERQPTATRASLRAIYFVNPFVGWIVGREERPNGSSSGVILFTSDGGIRWQRLAWNSLPGLHAVRFFDEKNGIVAGEAHDRYSSGVFMTQDGGRSWKIVPGPRQANWVAADFAAMDRGTLVGCWGMTASLQQHIRDANPVDVEGQRHLWGIARTSRHLIVVGQGGLIQTADPETSRWQVQTVAGWSADGQTACDYYGVCARGEHAWIVGRPGSVILHSNDGGETWSPQPTGQNVPLHGVYFLDAQTGWAVGELGTILCTTDGGKTWRATHRGGHRLAALAVHTTVTTSHLETLAELGTGGGYLVGALHLVTADGKLAPDQGAAALHRWVQVVRGVGGAAAESQGGFPLADYDSHLPAAELLSIWDRLHHGRAREVLVRQLVLAIRMWQPEIVVSDRATDGPSQVLHEALREAFEKAADSQAFSEQLQSLRLKPWAVRRWFVSAGGASVPMGTQTIVMAANEPLPRCGDTARELARTAAEMAGLAWQSPSERRYHLEATRIENDRPQHLWDGITLAHGGTARREQLPWTPEEVKGAEEIALAARRCHNIESLARAEGTRLLTPEQLVSQLSELTRGLPPERAVHSVWRLGRLFAATGRWPLAQDTFDWLVQRYPVHPLAAEAYRWLASYAASAEARRRYETTQASRHSEYQVKPAAESKPMLLPVAGVEGQEETLHGLAQRRGWHAAALPLEKGMAALGSLDLHDPAFQFALQSARRSLGDLATARTWMSTFVKEASLLPNRHDAWREAAAAELWLSQRGTPPKRPIAICPRLSERPTLDGKLDDPCWSDVPTLTLTHAFGRLDEADSTRFRWAYDQEYLYIAVECRHKPGRQVRKVDRRRRDDDLQVFDRISILLDIDRDYQTYFHLQIDQRGCVHDDCWGDSTWNPQWYVAHVSEETGWTVEAAIPLKELVSEVPATGSAWACQVSRIIPGRGLQSWSTPTDVRPVPEGMGLLLFSERQKK